MAQVRALVRKLVLEELRSSEVLEIRVIDPALARTFVGQAVNMLEQKKPDHKPCRNSRPTTVAIQRCDLAVEQVTGSSRGEQLDPVSLRPVARFLALTLSKYERGRPPAAAEAKP